MALPASPPISFSEVRTEFSSLGTSANLSAYVRGGAIVPDHGNTAGIPTVAAGMKLSDFYGADKDSPFSLTSPTPTGTAETITATPTAAYAYIEALVTGAIGGQGYSAADWGTPTGGTNGSGKYFRWTYVSGTSPSYTNMSAGTWYAVGSGYYVGHQRGSIGTTSGVIALQFADDGSGTGATTGGNWTITATMES